MKIPITFPSGMPLEERASFAVLISQRQEVCLQDTLRATGLTFAAYRVSAPDSSRNVRVSFEVRPSADCSAQACVERVVDALRAMKPSPPVVQKSRIEQFPAGLPASADSYGTLVDSPLDKRAAHRRVLRKKLSHL